jgi:hypothetical protein
MLCRQLQHVRTTGLPAQRTATHHPAWCCARPRIRYVRTRKRTLRLLVNIYVSDYRMHTLLWYFHTPIVRTSVAGIIYADRMVVLLSYEHPPAVWSIPNRSPVRFHILHHTRARSSRRQPAQTLRGRVLGVTNTRRLGRHATSTQAN